MMIYKRGQVYDKFTICRCLFISFYEMFGWDALPCPGINHVSMNQEEIPLFILVDVLIR